MFLKITYMKRYNKFLIFVIFFLNLRGLYGEMYFFSFCATTC